MKKHFVSDLVEGLKTDSLFAVKIKKPPTDYKGDKAGKWFELRVADKTGEITARFWGEKGTEVDKIYESFEKGDIVRISGKVREFMNKPEISISPSEGGVLERVEEYDLSDFVAKSKRDIDEMEKEVLDFVLQVDNNDLKRLLKSFFEDDKFMKKFKFSPAAVERHQNFVGGLIEHTLNVVKISLKLAELYPQLDKNLIIAGALLHDIGKTTEFTIDTTIDVSEEGMLLGHIMIGAKMIDDKITALNKIEKFERITRLKILHMILSHHGKMMFGSPKMPQFPEALVVYYADEMDAKTEYQLRLKEGANTEDAHLWTKDFGQIYLK